ncbi:MAG: bifunctional alpha,alpha-trehalose-phosphate synthase (UDP-forming)/trehalose-phosphatase [Bacteroidaceae bacterium]
MKLIILSNRLPIRATRKNGRLSFVPSEGGLATGLSSLKLNIDKHWIGWPGIFTDDEEEKRSITEHLLKFNYHPVFLSEEQIEGYYHEYSNSIIWPLCHYFFLYVKYGATAWQTYQEVNNLFAEAAASLIDDDDLLWVQDYQLMLLPEMLRRQNENCSIGYFHHIPFPSYELFRILPERAQILKGLFGADLIGFHTPDYMRHFMSASERVLKSKFNIDATKLDNRMVHVEAFPMGINFKKYHDGANKKGPKKIADEWKNRFGSRKIILSVDRLDYSKGIVHRVKAFNLFLEEHPEYHEKVSLVMVVVPSRDKVDAYVNLKKSVNETIGRINGKYSTLSWTPVHFFYQSFSLERLIALYKISDIGLVTPLRDGMNLVAKEFVAAKQDDPGVLILSEMAGAAQELSEAILVNPNDLDEIKHAIWEALQMPVDDQLRRMQKMQKTISTQTVQKWAADFIDELLKIKEENKMLSNKLLSSTQKELFIDDYHESAHRLIILDYDGTLAPFTNNPEEAAPSEEVLKVLKDLIDDPRNLVAISSGRDQDTLTKWFGHLPLILAAEHGAFIREYGIWRNNLPEKDWDKDIVESLKRMVQKTPGSSLEKKKTALVWHYRKVDPWTANLREQQLINLLRDKCAREGLQIMRGNKIVEIKAIGCDKGAVVKRLLKEGMYDFMCTIGDDTTDEDMFRAMPERAYTIKVGEVSNAARFYIKSQSKVLPLLQSMLKTLKD